MNKAIEAFADVRTPARQGICHACHTRTERGARINVRVAATSLDPVSGTKNIGLGSSGRTFCPKCARSLFDRLSDQIENGGGAS